MAYCVVQFLLPPLPLPLALQRRISLSTTPRWPSANGTELARLDILDAAPGSMRFICKLCAWISTTIESTWVCDNICCSSAVRLARPRVRTILAQPRRAMTAGGGAVDILPGAEKTNRLVLLSKSQRFSRRDNDF